MNTKNSTKRQLCCRLAEFLVFNSIGRLIILPSDEVYRLDDGGPDHADVLHLKKSNGKERYSLRKEIHLRINTHDKLEMAVHSNFQLVKFFKIPERSCNVKRKPVKLQLVIRNLHCQGVVQILRNTRNGLKF